MKPLALYLHLPFCAAKCRYCDFASYPGRGDAWSAYLSALAEEWRQWLPKLESAEIATVFFGGGTPSLLPAKAMERLLGEILDSGRVRADAEITMEANPGTVSPDKLRRLRRAGVNRLSLGAQSFSDALLRSLGRIHRASDIADAVAMAQDADFDNLNLDLMYALPGQSLSDWRETLDAAMALCPEHLSAYSLIVEPGTPLHADVERGAVSLPDEDETMAQQRETVGRLAAGGYGRYEISNYARPGFECRHNLVYWNRGDYLGLGCAAHSLMDGERFENPRSLEEYLAGARRLNREKLTRADAMEETLMLSTRTTRGMSLRAYAEDFGVDFEKAHEKKLRRLVQLGLVRLEDGFLRLTEKGMELQNAVVVELMDDQT